MTASNHTPFSTELLKQAEARDSRLAVALRACEMGGDVLLKYWQELSAEDIREKSKGDLVTRADLESERVISSFLRDAYPDAGVHCEEGTQHRNDKLVWYLDPLDGTTNFVQRFPIFAVSLGLVENPLSENPVLQCGVVFNPVSGELFWGAKGQGSYLGLKRLSVSDKTRLSDAVLATGFPRRYYEELPPYLQEFASIFPKCRAIRRAGAAALDLCWTAQGIFDGFWEHKLSPWDVAAGALIVEEAGGICSDFKGGREFLKSGNIIGASPPIHEEILHLVKPISGSL